MKNVFSSIDAIMNNYMGEYAKEKKKSRKREKEKEHIPMSFIAGNFQQEQVERKQ